MNIDNLAFPFFSLSSLAFFPLFAFVKIVKKEKRKIYLGYIIWRIAQHFFPFQYLYYHHSDPCCNNLNFVDFKNI